MEDQQIQELSRRKFLQAACAVAGGTLALAACGDSEPTPLIRTDGGPNTAETSNGASPIETKHDTSIVKRTEPLATNGDEELMAIARIEHDGNLLQQGTSFDGAMRFLPMPGDDIDTSWCPDGIRVFTDNALPSLIVLEPNGNAARLATNTTDPELGDYYASLGSAITPDDDVTLVIAPEPQAGAGEESWHGITPENYPKIIAHQTHLIRDHAPNARVAALLDIRGDDPQFFDQLTKIKGVDSFIVQAFANNTPIQFSHLGGDRLVAHAESYLNPKKIKALSSALGESTPIIINTGIPATDNGRSYNTAERLAVAEAIIANTKSLRLKGVNVTGINLFAQDKTRSEGIDFGFNAHDAKEVIPALVRGLNNLGVRVFGYSAKAD